MQAMFGRIDNGVAATRAGNRRRLAAVAVLLLLLLIVPAVPRAEAASKAVLAKFCSAGTASENKGGQCRGNKGIAVNLAGNGGVAKGSVYVAEFTNHRVQQFTAAGSFLRAWGFDVVQTGKPEDTGAGFEVCTIAADCKAGVASALGGGLNQPSGVTVDQGTGIVYVADKTNRRISVFSATGAFQGAFGWNVAGTGDPGDTAPVNGFEFCTTVCQAGPTGVPSESAGALALTGTSEGMSLSISPATGDVFIPDGTNVRINEFDPIVTAGQVTGATFVRAIGWDVVPGGSTGLETCTTETSCKKGVAGAGAGQFANTTSPGSVAVDTNGFIYAVNLRTTGNCEPAQPCGVLKFNPDGTFKENWGPVEGSCQLHYSSELATNVEALDVAIDPATNNVLVTKKSAADRVRVYEFDEAGSASSCVISPAADVAGVPVGSATAILARGLALGDGGKIYLHVSAAAGGEIYILGDFPPSPVSTPDCSAVTATSATCTGTVTIPSIEGGGAPTTYRFEYSRDGKNWIRQPSQDVSLGSIPGPVPVDETIKNLSPRTFYQVRICATTSSTVCSNPTAGINTYTDQPLVDLTYSEEVTQSSAVLGAHVNPSGAKTRYFFEWGTAPGDYSKRVPAFDRQLGGGSESLIANETISGLQAGTEYHFRVVAENFCHPISDSDPILPGVACVSEGPDQAFETLNACGLTDGRCFELVSPAGKGPVGAAGDTIGNGQELRFQADPLSPRIAYEMAYALPDASSGGEVVYQANRGSAGWNSSQLTAPTTAVAGAESIPSVTLGLAEDLSCGFFASYQPLASDAPTAATEAGVANLFRRNQDGSWTTVTTLTPTNQISTPMIGQYRVIGMSEEPSGDQCGRVVFRAQTIYPGIAGAGGFRVYEWDHGTIRNVGLIPGPGEAEEVVPAIPGAAGNPDLDNFGDIDEASNFWNAVSDDASRIYFTAVSKVGGDLNRQAIFLREDGDVAVDVSQSQTATPNNDDSRYATASDDGGQVFFTARYGLAAESSAGTAVCSSGIEEKPNGPGCDLYRYSAATGALSDLSADDGDNPSGASVAGVLGIDKDGSHVYFAARGQLDGQGDTESENLANDTYNIYLSVDDDLTYVGSLSEQGADRALTAKATAGSLAPWSSRVSEDGRYLLFESRSRVTEQSSGDRTEAYLFDATASRVQCVSCRRDGKMSSSPVGYEVITNGSNDANNKLNPASSLTVAADGTARVFFKSLNRLASGATEGEPNLYQWSGGQISFLSSSVQGSAKDLQFAGASANGDDVYFTTLDQLTWDDTDGQLDLYDARVGGGIPQPPGPPVPCNPLTEGSCQDGSGSTGSPPTPPSSVFNGPGNEAPPPEDERCTKLAQTARAASAKSKRLFAAAKEATGKKARKLKKRAEQASQSAKRASQSAKTCREASR